MIEESKRGKPNDILDCNTCQGKFTWANRSKHNQTKQHQQALKYETIIKNTLHQQLPTRGGLSNMIESPYYDWNGERIYMTKKKFDYYNTISMTKNGYPLYFKTQIDRKRTIRDLEETESTEENDETDNESYETSSEANEESEDSLSFESGSDDENTSVHVPHWFVKKLDDPNTPREELKKMLLTYNKLAVNQGVEPLKIKKKWTTDIYYDYNEK